MMKPLLAAIRKQPVPHTPVWMMRQAGRYLPEYRELRAQSGGFLHMCQTPEIACEITLQPIRRFPVDAAIIFSDILTIPDAMGLGLSFVEGEGPCFAKTIRSEADILALPKLDAERDLGYVGAALRLVASALPSQVALIGFAGSPWTIATYMIEGKSSKGKNEFLHSKNMLYQQPELMHVLLNALADAVADYLLMQIRSGAEVVQIFDTWGGVLPVQSYLEFSLASIQRIIRTVQQKAPDTPVIVFTKGGGQWLQAIAETGCDAIGLDWTTSLTHARNQVGHKCALQGNLDPAILRQNPSIIRQHTHTMLKSFGNRPGYIANLGHGITPDIPLQHAAAFVESVHQFQLKPQK